jgi:hypothetical protein
MYKVCVQSVPNLLSVGISYRHTGWVCGTRPHLAAAQTPVPAFTSPSTIKIAAMLSSSVARPLQLITRVMQWSSAVIVMGITSYFIHLGPRGQHLIYQEVIVCPLLCIPSCLCTDEIVHTVGRLLPTGLHLPVRAHGTEQIRPCYRRHLLIPVCFSPSLSQPDTS